MAAARRSSVARRSSAANPADFAHPYLATAPHASKPKRRELGLCNLFLFKLCGCFSGDDELPPPNFETPIYQATKSSSSNFTFNTNTTTTPTASRTHSPSKHTALSTTTTNTTNTANTTTTTTTAPSRASSARYGIIGATGVEDIPYRRPPPEQQAQAPAARYSTRNNASPGGASRSFSKSAPHSEGVSTLNVPKNRASDAWESRAPVELAENDELETRKIVGNVSRLSAMFDQEE